MSDLHTRLDEIAGPAVAPSAATLDADLSRARRARQRRRTGRIVAGSSLAVAAVLAAALAIPGLSPGTKSTPGTANRVSTRVATQLVAYTGKQPAGFTLDRVPRGWEVQGVDKYVLTLAPKDTVDKDHNNCVGKICIDQQKAIPDVKTQQVRVGDRPAVLATMEDDRDGVPGTLFVKQPSGLYLVIQVWNGLNWSGTDIVQFAAGVHVNPGAGFTVG
jgi:hypothetical protein